MTFETADNTIGWYAIHVKSNRERITAQALRGKGFETFIPAFSDAAGNPAGSNSTTRRSYDLLLFSGYIFCRFDVRKRLPVLSTPGVVRIVGRGQMPEPVDPEELAGIYALTRVDLHVTPCPYPPPGHPIRFERGPLSGLQGVLLEHTEKGKVAVSVTLLQRSVAINVEPGWITPSLDQISSPTKGNNNVYH